MNEQEILYLMALTKVPFLNLQQCHVLLETLGNATTIYENRKDIANLLPEASANLKKSLPKMEEHLTRAEEELRFTQQKHIQCIGWGREDYPTRLTDCPDAPILLYYRGSAPLNRRKVMAIVGTRQITEYGKDICRNFIRELSELCPDVLVVSGLAYGVDVHAQRAALENGMDTVGVVAHGLDQIYPRAHRETAIKMLEQGGILTEFMSQTAMDKRNFVQRNRIVAGISDCTVVVESASKGGSLITAEIAEGYHRDVFAFPGRIKDTYSAGCNDLIRSNRAQLLTNAEELINAMNWETEATLKKQLQNGIQQELFPTLNDDEKKIVNALQKAEGKQINILVVETGLPIGLLSSLLFNLEMKGVVKMMAGGMYRLL